MGGADSQTTEDAVDVMFSGVVRALCRRQDVTSALAEVAEMEAAGGEPGPDIFLQLLHACAIARPPSLRELETVWARIEVSAAPGHAPVNSPVTGSTPLCSTSYSVLIVSLGRAGLAQKSSRLLVHQEDVCVRREVGGRVAQNGNRPNHHGPDEFPRFLPGLEALVFGGFIPAWTCFRVILASLLGLRNKVSRRRRA